MTSKYVHTELKSTPPTQRLSDALTLTHTHRPYLNIFSYSHSLSLSLSLPPHKHKNTLREREITHSLTHSLIRTSVSYPLLISRNTSSSSSPSIHPSSSRTHTHTRHAPYRYGRRAHEAPRRRRRERTKKTHPLPSNSFDADVLCCLCHSNAEDHVVLLLHLLRFRASHPYQRLRGLLRELHLRMETTKVGEILRDRVQRVKRNWTRHTMRSFVEVALWVHVTDILLLYMRRS